MYFLCALYHVPKIMSYSITLLLKFNLLEIFHVYRCVVSTWEWVHHKPEAIHYNLKLLDDSKEGNMQYVDGFSYNSDKIIRQTNFPLNSDHNLSVLQGDYCY